jgi:hypothetical protein
MSAPPNIAGKPDLSTTMATMQQQNQKQLQKNIAAGQATAFIAPPPDDISGTLADSVSLPSSTTESVSDSISPTDSELVNGPYTGYCLDANLASPVKTAAQCDVGSTVSNSDIVGGELDY